jgi:hypothetical protein
MQWKNIKHMSEGSFKRLTGVELKTFRFMVKSLKLAASKKAEAKLNNRTRPFILPIEDQLLLMLMYYREYRTQFHIGVTYGISEASVCRTIKRVETILMKEKRFKLPGKESLSGSNHSYSVVVIDATEHPIERPKKIKKITSLAKKGDIH